MSAMTGKMDYQLFQDHSEHIPTSTNHTSFFQSFPSTSHKFLKFLRSRNNKKAVAEQLWATSNEAALALLLGRDQIRWKYFEVNFGGVVVWDVLLVFSKMANPPPKTNSLPLKNTAWKTIFLKWSLFKWDVNFRGVRHSYELMTRIWWKMIGKKMINLEVYFFLPKNTVYILERSPWNQNYWKQLELHRSSSSILPQCGWDPKNSIATNGTFRKLWNGFPISTRNN